MDILKKFKVLGDINTFSWAQALNDKSGKTSVLPILALVTVACSLLLMLASGIAALFGVAAGATICSYSLAGLTLGASMAGVHKFKDNPITEDTDVTPAPTDQPNS